MKASRFRLSIVWAAFVLLAWTTYVLLGDGPSPTQTRLSWSKSPKTTMTVVWQTASPTESSVVEYGITEKLGKRAMGRRVTYPYKTGMIHEALISGLDPDMRYFYRVGDSKAGFSVISSFKTAPNRGEDILFTAFGDHGLGKVSKSNVDLVLAEKPAFHLILGDLSYANGKQKIWDEWFEQLEPLSRSIPVMPALGNHENEEINGRRIGYTAYQARFALPHPETRYSFDYSEARFVSFNTDDFSNEEQTRWFVDTLKKAQADKNIRWVIVYQHHPLYSSTIERLNNEPLIAAVRHVLDQYKVDLVLAGHNHNYERSYPLVGETIVQSGSGPYQKGKGTVFVISGGGGRPLYKFTPEVPVITSRRESVWHYLRVRATKKELRVEAIRTKERTVLDSFTIQAP